MLDEALWKEVAEFHGHECPGLAIGFKACEGAVAELGLDAGHLRASDEEVVCVSENDACGNDAVQFILGCTYGKSNLIARLRGKMAFSFFVRDTDRQVRLMLKDLRGDKSRADYQRFLLTTPYERLFEVGKPAFGLPEAARLFSSQACAVCGEQTAEFALRLQGGRPVCLDCYDAYDREGF